MRCVYLIPGRPKYSVLHWAERFGDKICFIALSVCKFLFCSFPPTLTLICGGRSTFHLSLLTVPDRGSRNLEVVVVRRINNLGTGNLEWVGGSGEN
jgi:hypothetical protein